MHAKGPPSPGFVATLSSSRRHIIGTSLQRPPAPKEQEPSLTQTRTPFIENHPRKFLLAPRLSLPVAMLRPRNTQIHILSACFKLSLSPTKGHDSPWDFEIGFACDVLNAQTLPQGGLHLGVWAGARQA